VSKDALGSEKVIWGSSGSDTKIEAFPPSSGSPPLPPGVDISGTVTLVVVTCGSDAAGFPEANLWEKADGGGRETGGGWARLRSTKGWRMLAGVTERLRVPWCAKADDI
jgi:hypothetical protein